MPVDPPRRALCATCQRPSSTCICHWIARAPFDAELLILQHPLETGQAKGSARLLHLCVPGSMLVTGETFDSASLAQLLHGGGRTPLLLYPQEGMAPAVATPGPPAGLRLVLLDGTWRKTRKMLHLNPLLAALPRLALRGLAPSRYRIRKAHAPDQLSSLEAAAHALAQLQGESALAPQARLLSAFDGFVGQQASYAAAGAAP